MPRKKRVKLSKDVKAILKKIDQLPPVKVSKDKLDVALGVKCPRCEEYRDQWDSAADELLDARTNYDKLLEEFRQYREMSVPRMKHKMMVAMLWDVLAKLKLARAALLEIRDIFPGAMRGRRSLETALWLVSRCERVEGLAGKVYKETEFKCQP